MFLVKCFLCRSARQSVNRFQEIKEPYADRTAVNAADEVRAGLQSRVQKFSCRFI
ncbi:MAG: hypothetical protein JXA07_06040 [Spirochaetes bacterium]|nr:hypothetical protein [Spirochaetota bacterium]